MSTREVIAHLNEIERLSLLIKTAVGLNLPDRQDMLRRDVAEMKRLIGLVEAILVSSKLK